MCNEQKGIVTRCAVLPGDKFNSLIYKCTTEFQWRYWKRAMRIHRPVTAITVQSVIGRQLPLHYCYHLNEDLLYLYLTGPF